MENQTSQATSLITDEFHDLVFIYKISNDLSLSERLKNTTKILEVFTPLKNFCTDLIKVSSSCTFYN